MSDYITFNDEIQRAFDEASEIEQEVQFGAGAGLSTCSTCHFSPFEYRQPVFHQLVTEVVDGQNFFGSRLVRHDYVSGRVVTRRCNVVYYDVVRHPDTRRYIEVRQVLKNRPVPIEYQSIATKENPRVEVWGDGQFAKVYTGRVRREKRQRSESEEQIDFGDSISQLADGEIVTDLYLSLPKKRSSVRFSKKSRKRLMETLAKTKRHVKPLFVTLTYPDEFSDDKRDWKRDIDTFGKRFLRRFPRGAFVWRMELKERKTGVNAGRVAPHFHLLVWGVVPSRLRRWVSRSWFEVVGSGDERHLRAGTSVERIRSARGVMAYASKYISKVDEAHSSDVGRHWGIIGRDNVPFS